MLLYRNLQRLGTPLMKRSRIGWRHERSSIWRIMEGDVIYFRSVYTVKTLWHSNSGPWEWICQYAFKSFPQMYNWRTSKKLCMKFCGSFAPAFSVSLKYFIMCDICFQKFNVSWWRYSISVILTVLPVCKCGCLLPSITPLGNSQRRERESSHTWNSARLWNSNISTTGNLLTYLCRSNSCRIFVRSCATGKLREYIVWISGACDHTVNILIS